MSLIKPFKGIIPKSTLNFTSHQNKLYPKEEIILTDELYDQKFLHYLENNCFIQHSSENYYLYRATQPNKISCGIIVQINLENLEKIIFPHEKTFAEKENLYFQSIKTTKIQLNPPILLHKHNTEIEFAISQYVSKKSDLKIDTGQITHELWILNNFQEINHLTLLLNTLKKIYIADGHHRVKALQRYYSSQTQNRDSYMLSLLISENNIDLKSYNRILKFDSYISMKNFLVNLSEKFSLEEISEPKKITSDGIFICYENDWLKLVVKNYLKDSPHYPVIHKLLFSEVVEATLSYRIQKIEYRPEISNWLSIKNTIQNSACTMAIFLPKITFPEFFNLVDKKIIFPANSTWFEPKLPDGLIASLKLQELS